jgi:DNA repair exonuclease SbcCD ATPase subunit
VSTSEKDRPMKILALTAENVKRLTAVHIEPNGNLVQITGRNGQGKTSVLDAISWAIEGASKVQSAPIRKGQDRAKIRLDLGDVIVTREFRKREDGTMRPSTVTVESADGARFGSPETMLKSFLGTFTFDPLAFTRMDAAAQLQALRQFVPDVDFDAIEKANKADFAKRTDINRRAKEARAAAGKIDVPMGLPDAPLDEDALVQAGMDASQQNADRDKERERRSLALAAPERAAVHAKRLMDKAEELRAEAKRLDQEAADHVVGAKQQAAEVARLDAVPDNIDLAEARNAVQKARTVNAGIAARVQRNAHDKTADTLEAEANVLTEAMNQRKKDATAAVAVAKMPVAGLEFGEGVVLLNDVPFDQASDAEQLRTSIAIAMASNPRLRVIRVRDGSLLDEDAMTLLAQMADEANCQVWIERVDSSGQVGFVIQDGEVLVRPAALAEQPSLLGAAE